jgi:hypothetical protein
MTGNNLAAANEASLTSLSVRHRQPLRERCGNT